VAATRSTLSAAPLTVAMSASITAVGALGRPNRAGHESGSVSTRVFSVGS
jgi:hypothetical protein